MFSVLVRSCFWNLSTICFSDINIFSWPQQNILTGRVYLLRRKRTVAICFTISGEIDGRKYQKSKAQGLPRVTGHLKGDWSLGNEYFPGGKYGGGAVVYIENAALRRGKRSGRILPGWWWITMTSSTARRGWPGSRQHRGLWRWCRFQKQLFERG